MEEEYIHEIIKGNVVLIGNNIVKLPDLSDCKVEGNYIVRSSNLKNLIGAPCIVSKSSDCSECSLTSLKGCPTEVGGNFDCSSNRLESLDHAPEKVGGDFTCAGKPGNFSEEYVELFTDVSGDIVTDDDAYHPF